MASRPRTEFGSKPWSRTHARLIDATRSSWSTQHGQIEGLVRQLWWTWLMWRLPTRKMVLCVCSKRDVCRRGCRGARYAHKEH